MKITLGEKEINAAVELWIEGEGFSLKNKQVDIAFTAGRGPNGLSAEVDVTSADSSEAAREAAPATSVEDTDSDAEQDEELPEDEDEESEPVSGAQPALDLDLDMDT